jgi:outer membrane murein-binding lipoprotein Lpp
MQQLSQTKDEMNAKVADIEQQLNKVARDAQAAGQRDAARKASEAAGVVNNEMIKRRSSTRSRRWPVDPITRRRSRARSPRTLTR